MTDYRVIDDPEQKFQLLSGPYKNTIYKYRSLRFNDDNTKAHFDYQLCYVPENVEINEEFELEIFRILMEIIEESLERSKTECSPKT